MADEPAIREKLARNPDGTFPPGVSGNPSGRPRNTLKDFMRRKFNRMTDAEFEQWLKDNKIPGEVQWRMAEGNPHQSSDTELKGSLTVQFSSDFQPDEDDTEKPSPAPSPTETKDVEVSDEFKKDARTS